MGAFDQPASAMNPIEQRIADSFQKQGLMATLGAELLLAQEGEVQIAIAPGPSCSFSTRCSPRSQGE